MHSVILPTLVPTSGATEGELSSAKAKQDQPEQPCQYLSGAVPRGACTPRTTRFTTMPAPQTEAMIAATSFPVLAPKVDSPARRGRLGV